MQGGERSGLVAAAAFSILAACGAPEDSRAPAASERPVAGLSGEFLGVWAARPALCGRSEWRISPTTMTSQSGVACVLAEHRPSAGGWTAQAACADLGDGVVEFHRGRDEPPSLVLSGAPFEVPITLVRCGGPGAPAPARDPHGLLEMANETDLAIASRAAGVVARTDLANAALREAWWRDGQLIKAVEPSVAQDDGARRTFYFQPGVETPFLVRTPERAFGFSGGRLTEVYSGEGERLGPAQLAGLESEAQGLLREARVARQLAEGLKRMDKVARRAGAQREEMDQGGS